MMLSLGYYGGKAYFVKELLSVFPSSHHTYVEVFGGGASLLLNKPVSPVEVYNDIDENVVAFFRCVRDAEKVRRLLQYLLFTPFSRREAVSNQKAITKGEDMPDDVIRAGRWFTAVYQSFSYELSGWSYSVGMVRGGVAHRTHTWRKKICKLRAIHQRIKNVQVECADFEDVIKRYDAEHTLFYCDPPYVYQTRVRLNSYLHEMPDEEHLRFLECALRVKGKMIISNYSNPLYDKHLASWQRHCFRAVAFASHYKQVKQKGRRSEVVWTNYTHQLRLEF